MHRVRPLLFQVPGLSLARVSPSVQGAGFPLVPLRPGTAAAAHDYYRGRFALAGAEAVGGPGGILDAPAPSAGWAAAFHGFGWLADLEASGLELHRIHARGLLGGWIDRRFERLRPARAPNVAARRLMALTVHAPFLLRGAPQAFLGRFCRLTTGEIARLSRAQRLLRRADERFLAATALAYACAGLRGLDSLAPAAFARLDGEIDAQILADGGHVSRSPEALLEALRDLLPLKLALAASRRSVSPRLAAAIERMLPMLRLLSHGDGGLAVFQGVGDLKPSDVQAVLEADPVQGRPLLHAGPSGYVRLAHGGVLVIADAGEPRACMGPLAFEFSDGPCRIVVNCGLPAADNGVLARAACTIAAHSTAEAGSSPCAAPGLLARMFRREAAGASPPAEAAVSAGGSLFRAVNAQAAAGLAHERRLYLAAKGNDLRGEDRFHADSQQSHASFIIRFHLHPSVKATLSKDGGSVTLAAANRCGWRFSARGARLALEDSLFFPAAPRRSQQITLSGESAQSACVNWAFKRIEKREGKKPKAADAPALPF